MKPKSTNTLIKKRSKIDEPNEVKLSIEVAAKIADAIEISLDFLVGKSSVELDSKTLKRL
ncbi:MAG: hypothetical protein ACJ75B_02845 [Flavisolibacter sp.]